MSQQLLTTRQALPSDHAFVYATYLRSRWYSSDNATTLQKDTWMAAQHGRLERLLREQLVTIACIAADPDVILGYAFQDGSTPFRYVRPPWRNPALGVIKLLEDAVPNKEQP